MPQLDQEIFLQYLICIFLILLQIFSNETVSENLLKLNARFFLLQMWSNLEKIYKKENSILQKWINKSIFKRV